MIRHTISFAVLLVLFLTPVIISQDSFEGMVKYKITADGETVDMNYFVKGDKIKMDMEGESNVSVIFSNKDKVMLMIMPDQKMYMEMPIRMEAGGPVESESDIDESDFVKTGEKKEIAGYTCEKWLYNDDESEVESWLTKELGSFIFFGNPMEQDKKPEWQSQLETEGYFPVLVIVKDSKGKVESRMEVIEVEEKSLNDNLFMPPAGYEKLSMPGIQ
jgi:hypothetical protein